MVVIDRLNFVILLKTSANLLNHGRSQRLYRSSAQGSPRR
jgi:hypothetical protein